jgi:hypothetical protein
LDGRTTVIRWRFELVAETMRPMLEEFAFKPAP